MLLIYDKSIMFLVTAAHCAKPEVTNAVIGETNRKTEYDCLYPGTYIEHPERVSKTEYDGCIQVHWTLNTQKGYQKPNT